VAAFEVGGEHGEVGVVVLAEGEKDIEGTDEVAATVRRAVAAEHDVALGDFRLLQPGAVPRTSSGKVARSAARAAFLAEQDSGWKWTR
jgi:acyl-CoA synthetase (AMP-forming)/AMP-acid ligase II